jgi:hypothetical protein
MLRNGIWGGRAGHDRPTVVPGRWRARRTHLPQVAEAGEFFSGLTAATASQAPEEPPATLVM